MEDLDVLGSCESCGKKIRAGELHHYTSDGCWLCEEHSPMLSDILRQMDEVIKEGSWESSYGGDYDSQEELIADRDMIARQIAEEGDRKVASK